MDITLPGPECYLGENLAGPSKLSLWPGDAWGGGRNLPQPWSRSSRHLLCTLSATSSTPERPHFAPSGSHLAMSQQHQSCTSLFSHNPGSAWNKASAFVALSSISLWWLRNREPGENHLPSTTSSIWRCWGKIWMCSRSLGHLEFPCSAEMGRVRRGIWSCDLYLDSSPTPKRALRFN